MGETTFMIILFLILADCPTQPVRFSTPATSLPSGNLGVGKVAMSRDACDACDASLITSVHRARTCSDGSRAALRQMSADIFFLVQLVL